MEQFFPFFVVIFAGVFFSGLFKRLHFPWVATLLLGGIIIGPQILNIFKVDQTINFIGQIGLIFLMFMAGLEIKLSSFKKFRTNLFWLSLINGAIPFIVGFGIAYFMNYDLISSLLLGIIFVSSSVAIVIPSLESSNLIHSILGKEIVASIVVEDILSLVLLSILLQSINPITVLPLPVFYILLLLSLIILRWLIPKIRKIFSLMVDDRDRQFFQTELRLILSILIGTVIVFEILGLHPIIAGFFAGLVLSDSIKSERLIEKIRTISYGIFIPTFFIVIGAQTDISVFYGASDALLLILLILIGSVLAKFFSGYLGGRIIGMTSQGSKVFGAASIAQLSTTLAVVFTSFELGLLDQKLLTAMVILSIATTFIGPILVKIFSRGYTGS